MVLKKKELQELLLLLSYHIIPLLVIHVYIGFGLQMVHGIIHDGKTADIIAIFKRNMGKAGRKQESFQDKTDLFCF